MIDDAFPDLVEVTSIKRACQLLGKPRATHYRQQRSKPARTPAPRLTPPNALTPVQRAEVLDVLHSDRFVDKAPAQVWAALLDEGTYLCSESTMYRLLRAHGEVRERRRQATHPPRVRPELVAFAPNEVWSWDVTKLKGPYRGVYYDLFVMLDIYSRYVVGWQVTTTENGELAEEFIADAIARTGAAPKAVHADRGTSMTSKPVAVLLADLGIARSHSRPRVSNDNPYSEAQFKTLKHCPAFPDRFGSIHDARAFCEQFIAYYNHEYRHSGIGLHTLASVHFGTAHEIRTQRVATLDAAFAANPTRFRHRRPVPPRIPGAAWINQPPPVIQTM